MTEQAQTAGALVAEYLEVRERIKALDAAVGSINERARELNEGLQELAKERGELLGEMKGVRNRRDELEREYRRATGRDLKKSLRTPTAESLDQAYGALGNAVMALDPSDPVTQRRFAAWAEAFRAHMLAKEAEGRGEPS